MNKYHLLITFFLIIFIHCYNIDNYTDNFSKSNLLAIDTFYHDNGNFSEITFTYKNNYSRMITFYETGDKQTIGYYYNKYIHGTTKAYSKLGNLRLSIDYVSGIRHGEYVQYLETGKKTFWVKYENGLKVGPQYCYLPNGDIVTMFCNKDTALKDQFLYDKKGTLLSHTYGDSSKSLYSEVFKNNNIIKEYGFPINIILNKEKYRINDSIKISLGVAKPLNHDISLSYSINDNKIEKTNIALDDWNNGTINTLMDSAIYVISFELIMHDDFKDLTRIYEQTITLENDKLPIIVKTPKILSIQDAKNNKERIRYLLIPRY